MLSMEVVYAVLILTKLESCKRERGNLQGFSREDIFGESLSGTKLTRRVLSILLSNGYVKCKAGRYLHAKRLNEITFYELVKLFHGRVCLGYSLPVCLKGRYLYMPEFEKLRTTEQRIEDMLERRLGQMILSDYVSLDNKKS